LIAFDTGEHRGPVQPSKGVSNFDSKPPLSILINEAAQAPTAHPISRNAFAHPCPQCLTEPYL
jgi:hypothetical protein